MSKRQAQKYIQQITRQLIAKYDPEKIILFGSFAYGRPKENSDIDLMVIKKTRERFGLRLRQMAHIITDVPIDRDIIVYNPREWKRALRQKNPFIAEIDKKGKILYDKY